MNAIYSRGIQREKKQKTRNVPEHILIEYNDDVTFAGVWC